MESYASFAEVYDTFMDNMPYKEWAEYIIELLKENEIKAAKETVIVDLGCGTGTFARIWEKAGYSVIGVDNSPDMLTIASYNADEGSSILFTLQDMREFEVLNQVRAVISLGDSMNYITQEDDLTKVFKQVKAALAPNGIFIFDLKTEYYFKEILGENTFAEDRDNAAYIWDNYYYEEEHINEYELTLFIRQNNGLFKKQEELHMQRAYKQEEVERSLKTAGLEIIGVYHAFSEDAPKEDSERIYFVAKRFTS